MWGGGWGWGGCHRRAVKNVNREEEEIQGAAEWAVPGACGHSAQRRRDMDLHVRRKAVLPRLIVQLRRHLLGEHKPESALSAEQYWLLMLYS